MTSLNLMLIHMLITLNLYIIVSCFSLPCVCTHGAVAHRFRNKRIECLRNTAPSIRANRHQILAISCDAKSTTRSHSDATIRDKLREKFNSFKTQIIKSYFLPSGYLSHDYFTYAKWRLRQRFIAATSGVLGTQSLLLALGFRKTSIGTAAASAWILKDALGKVSRIFWGSKYGRKFDADAKQWRFLSSVFFALGNALEVMTYMVPSMFLVIAAIANALKQMALVTYSATRNTIYKSFSRGSDNIGDITAKGEAQIAVIDILGMLCGVMLSRIIGTSKGNIIAAFSVLTLLDMISIFYEIKSVVFDTLNFERTGIVFDNYFSQLETLGKSMDNASVLSPESVADREKIYLPSQFNEDVFKTMATSTIPMSVAIKYRNLFESKTEPFILQLHAIDVKQGLLSERIVQKIGGIRSLKITHRGNSKYLKVGKKAVRVRAEIILNQSASNIDIFRAMVVLYRAIWMISKIQSTDYQNKEVNCIDILNDKVLPDIVKDAYEFERENGISIQEKLLDSGWVMSKYMHGSVRTRDSW